jgi:hypothetical protein
MMLAPLPPRVVFTLFVNAGCFLTVGQGPSFLAAVPCIAGTSVRMIHPGVATLWHAFAALGRQPPGAGPHQLAYAQVGVIGFDGRIDLQSLRLYGLPEAAPAMLNGTPPLTGALFRSGRREFAAEVSCDLPSLAPGATSLLDATVNGARAGDLAQASLVLSTRFIELGAAMWSNNTVRVMARNISVATFDQGTATPSVQAMKRRVP